jgi:hypothetical protein
LHNFFLLGQVGNVITNRNASRLEFERLLVGILLIREVIELKFFFL